MVRIFTAFENALMQPGSRTLLEIARQELLPQNEQTRAMRKTWYQRKAAEMLPGLVSKELDRIDGLVKLDAEKQGKRLEQRQGAVQPEPASASSALPQGATEAQLRTKAEELAKADPGFANAEPDAIKRDQDPNSVPSAKQQQNKTEAIPGRDQHRDDFAVRWRPDLQRTQPLHPVAANSHGNAG